MALSSSSSPSEAVSRRQSLSIGCAPKKQLNNIEVLSLMRQQREHPSPLREWSPVHPGIQLRVNLLNKLISDLERTHLRLQQEAQKTQQASQIVQDFAAWPSIAPEYAAIRAANPWLAKQAAKYARPVIEKEYTQAIAFLQAKQRREQLPEGDKLKMISGEERTPSPASSPEEHRQLRKKASSQDLRSSLITHQGSPAPRRPRTPPEKEGGGRPKTPERPTPTVTRRPKKTPSPRQRPPPVNEIKKLRLSPHDSSKSSSSKTRSTPSGLSPSPMTNHLSKPKASPLACLESMGIVLTPEQRLEFAQRAEQLEAMAYLELRWHRLHYAMTEIQGFCVRGLAERESERIAKMMYPIRRRRSTATGGSGVSALRGLLAGLDEDDDLTLFGSDDDDDEFENELCHYEDEWEAESEDSDLDDECDSGENDDSDEDNFPGSAVAYNNRKYGGRGTISTSTTPDLFARAGAQSRLSMSVDIEQQQQQQHLPLNPHHPPLPDTPPVISSIGNDIALPNIEAGPEEPIALTPPATPKPAPRKINLNPRNVTLPPSNPRASTLNLNLGLGGGNLRNKPNPALAKEIDTLLPCEKENLPSTPLKTLNINRSNARLLGGTGLLTPTASGQSNGGKKVGIVDLGIKSRPPVLRKLGVMSAKEVDGGGKGDAGGRKEDATKENQPPAVGNGNGGAGAPGGGSSSSRPGLLRPGLGRRFSYHAGGGRVLG
ncbi:hypothetical protein NEUTE1DRAFT_88316 [Neurospora tetrasperma FGSC 2508]|uniref:Uncharacterized protein n=1 Tax=Neurospora tetrasperma (strain FGSC 2508 / ATCC MYA-4615 / P0657) TaxID=510951 RepID=F8MVB8_NEUT8|nr:uncharacterized protein NEUTE1DRAFT_88316 [Neurospora tetrasperma FGSC 2508]EGO54721.1 hypothetical protein NEUTE1DRAFT_88316 [Neurospora tetrasperma FGSC 2508]EGZ67803.1 hypothetical protein NEUTE2DRAFT_152480 [Neurospora tetrasperma FGSC 2509]